jgi:hypothetical protein
MVRRSAWLAGFVAAVHVTAAEPARAQDGGARLRGAIGASDDAAGAAAGELRGSVDSSALVLPAALRLTKPERVTRIGAPPDVAKELIGPQAGADPVATATISPPIEAAPDPVPALRRRAREEDAYAPIGLRTGAFLLYPSIAVEFGADSNPDKVESGADGATFVIVRPSLAFESDWSRHALAGRIEAEQQRFLSGDEESRPSLRGILDGRLDAAADTVLEGQLRLSLETEDIGTDSVPATALSRPTVLDYGATVGVTQRMGRFAFRLRGTVDRTQYEDTPLSGGLTLSGADRSLTTYGVELRTSYGDDAGLRPFVEATLDRRVYDNRVNANGEARGSRGYALRLGASAAMTGLLTGEVAVGYGGRQIDDPTLPDLDGLLVDASLVWEATALTSLTLRAATTFNETTTSGASGSRETSIGVGVQHAFRRNLVATAALDLSRTRFEGIPREDDGVTAALGFEYRLTRSLAVRADFTHERLDSSEPGSDYTANTVLVGLRLQP